MVADGVWVWTDGTAYDYQNWDRPSEPNGGTNENCVDVVYTGQGHWNDLPCFYSEHIFWCNCMSVYCTIDTKKKCRPVSYHYSQLAMHKTMPMIT